MLGQQGITRVGAGVIAVLAALTLAPIGVKTQTPGTPFQFTSIDYPGAVYTEAVGINAAGEIVGAYIDAGGDVYGFLLSGGNFTSLQHPDGVETDARGIGPGGNIVGVYIDQDGRMRGYKWSKGQFTPADFPGHLNTIPQRITPQGEIVGCYHDQNFTTTMFGMVMGPRGLRSTTVPASMHNGATPDGKKIVGFYIDFAQGNRRRGYVLENEYFTPFDAPNSIFTQAWDIGPTGDIVGDYRDQTAKHRGFLKQASGYTSIDYPNALMTHVRGINAGGNIVGFYLDENGAWHGFLLTRTQ